MIYEVGDKARLSVTFQDLTATPPVTSDPTTVTLILQSPDNTQSTLGPGSPIVRDSSGIYHYDLSITQSGTYLYRWVGTGTVADVQEGSIVVAPTTLAPQPAPPPPQWTLADLQTINAAIATGAAEVRFQDRTVRYQNADGLIKLRTIILNYLNAQNSVNVIRQQRVFTNPGYNTP